MGSEKRVTKINKTLFIALESQGEELLHDAKDVLKRRLGIGYEQIIQAAGIYDVSAALANLHTLDRKASLLCNKDRVDVFLLFNLTCIEEDIQRIPLAVQLTLAQQAYREILKKSVVQTFDFEMHALFLLPESSSLENLGRENLSADLQSLKEWGNFPEVSKDGNNLQDDEYLKFSSDAEPGKEQKEATKCTDWMIFHYGFLFTPENAYGVLSRHDLYKLVEIFLVFLVLSPLKNRVKKSLEEMISIHGGQGLPMFSAGVALLSTSNSEHRTYNYNQAKEVFLSKTFHGGADFIDADKAGKACVEEYLGSASPLIHKLKREGRHDRKSRNSAPGKENATLLHFLFDNEHQDYTLDIRVEFDKMFREWVFQYLLRSDFSIPQLRMALRTIQKEGEKLYYLVDAQAKEERKKELEKNYLLSKPGMWNSIRRLVNSTFKKSPLPNVKTGSLDEMKQTSAIFERGRSVRSFWEHIEHSVEFYILVLEDALNKTQVEAPAMEFSEEPLPDPFVVKLFEAHFAGIEQNAAFDYLFKHCEDLVGRSIDSFLRTQKREQNIPLPLDQILGKLLQSFDEHYYQSLEDLIYRDESKCLLEQCIRDSNEGMDVRRELLRLSSPYIRFFREWMHSPHLFVTTKPLSSQESFDDHHAFLEGKLVSEAFSEKTPWEIPVVQVEGPFVVQDTLYYQAIVENGI